MKILLISCKYEPEYSGSGYRAHNTYLRLNKKFGLEYDVICNSKLFSANKKYKYCGVSIYRISFPLKTPNSKSLSYYVISFLNIFWHFIYITFFLIKNKKKYSLLHTFGDTWTIGFATIIFSLLKKPIIRELCNETNYPMYPIQIHSLISNVFKNSNTLIIAISKRLYDVAKKYNPYAIWLRNNPVDEKKFYINYDNKIYLRKKFSPFNENDKVLSIIANILPRKNQLFCLKLINKLPKNYKLLIGGPLKDENKKYFNKLILFIKENKLQERVFIKNEFIKNIEDYIMLSDIFLFPSLSEGLGTPVIESQACGIPVLANLIPGITNEIITNGKGGFYKELDLNTWIEYIFKIDKIKSKLLVANSEEILKNSSSRSIDKLYLDHINKLHEK